MPDFSNPQRVTLLAGDPRTGKTTFGIRYLINAPEVACRFIFDDCNQVADRLGIRPCYTERECELAVPSRWVCFNPHRAFPGDKVPNGFKWFADWAMKVSARGPWRKIFFADELWRFVDARNIPPELSNIARTGHTERLELFTMTHRPREYHKDLKTCVTEWVCFRIRIPEELDAVRPFFPRVDKAATLLKGQFIAYNCDSGEELSGALW